MNRWCRPLQRRLRILAAARAALARLHAGPLAWCRRPAVRFARFAGAMPEATVLLCDAAESYKTRNTQLAIGSRPAENMRRFLVMDLLLGRVDANHRSFLAECLRPERSRSGMVPLQSADARCSGLDYYPHSDWQLDRAREGVRQHRADKPIGLHGVASAYWQRYGVPLMLTETSIEGQPSTAKSGLRA